MAYIHDNEGFSLAPAPMYESYKVIFEEALESHLHEELITLQRPLQPGV